MSRPDSRVPPLLFDLAAGRESGVVALDRRTVKLANEHGLTGLLWTWARDRIDDTSLKTELAQNDLYVQAHLVNVWSVLEESVMRLADAGIEVATIKGVTAEARWYSRRGERPCSDVDLLLSPAQLDQAAEAVRILEPDHPALPYVGPLARDGHIQTVTTRVNGIDVDLHFDLLKLGIPTRQSDVIWDRTLEYDLPGGGVVRILDDTTALAHFLVHMNKDRFQRLLGYSDISRIVKGAGVDWEWATHFATAEGIETSMFRSLEVVLDQLSERFPGELRRPRGPRVLAWNVIWRPGIRLRGAEGRLRFRRRQDWLALLARGRLLEGIRWWLRDVWPPASLVNVRYSGVRGPYLWKLITGRFSTSRDTRNALARWTEREKNLS